MSAMFFLVLLAASAYGQQLNVIETARRLGLYSYLAALEETNSVDLVEHTDSITVFIPSNDAFKAVSQETRDTWRHNPSYYQEMMRSHIVKGRFNYKDLIDEHPYPTFANSTGRFVNYQNFSVNVQVYTGAVIDTKNFDIQASNGVIHVVKQVVGSLQNGTLLEKALANPDLSRVSKGAAVAGLEDILNGPVPCTFFAPTDEAIGKLPSGAWDSLLKNVTLLKSILSRHVVKSGTWFSAGLTNNFKLETYNGNLTVSTIDGAVFVNGSKVLTADNAASNGVMHTIDTVILPVKFQAWVKGLESFDL